MVTLWGYTDKYLKKKVGPSLSNICSTNYEAALDFLWEIAVYQQKIEMVGVLNYL